MSRFLSAALVVAAATLFAAAQHPGKATKCADKCACAETGRCRCDPCPTEMSAGLTRRAVMEGRRLVAFVGVKSRPVAGCLVYNTPRAERGKPARYIAVFVPDGTGSGIRYDLPPDATDEVIAVTGDPKPPPPPPDVPAMPRTR